MAIDLRTAREALAHGASGFLLKDAPADRIVAAGRLTAHVPPPPSTP